MTANMAAVEELEEAPPDVPMAPEKPKRRSPKAKEATVPELLPSATGVQVVKDRETARRVVAALMAQPEPYYAVDTEVADIDVKSVSPVDHGYVTCLSIFGGPTVDAGEGPGKILWVDNLDGAEGVLEEFRPFLESEAHKKVWHNYSFDRHVLYNVPTHYEGGGRIDCRGFAGDTMHMARLWDTSMEKRFGEGGFSLEALSEKLLGGETARKVPMKELFGVAKMRKDGSPGSLKELPPIEQLQRDPTTRDDFIKYSARDAEATWQVEQTARQDQQVAQNVFLDWVRAIQPTAEGINPGSGAQIQTLLFGGAMPPSTGRGGGPPPEPYPAEREFKVDKTPEELAAMAASQDEFSLLTATQLKDACKAAGLKHTGSKGELLERLRNPPDPSAEPVLVDEFADMKVAQLKEACKTRGLKVGGKKADLLAALRGTPDPVAEFKAMKVKDLRDACLGRGLSAVGTKPDLLQRLANDTAYRLQLEVGHTTAQQPQAPIPAPAPTPAERSSLPAPPKPSRWKELVIRGLKIPPVKVTPKGQPAVSNDVLKVLAGRPTDDPPRYGRIFEDLGGGEAGKAACVAIDALCNMGSIDTMISTFLLPLQTLVDERSRVHCSLNINTETGRLSARRPNLQNQPALEKDQYKIRYAFQAEEGKRLIVADYGQLELRLLAHMANCKSMLDAFASGGCFHSRTAVGMFEHVKKAVDNGDVYLEWDYSKGKPDKPLVKDVYGAERRKAKTLNFSIAYGKTAHGLSKDWDVSVPEAQELLKAWYADRPEVQKWQNETIAMARETGYTRTLMGRYRKLPDIKSTDRGAKSHSDRAAINTPIQGGAADVAMMAMIKLVRSEKLRRLGWKLLLQVHDEVILEGPEESVEEAQEEVLQCMEHPWDDFGLKPLLVHLAVDADNAKTWYEAK